MKPSTSERAVSKKPKPYREVKEAADYFAEGSGADDAVYIVQTSRSGIKSSRFFDLADLTGLNRDWLATEVLGLSLKTLQRYNEERMLLSPRGSEAVLKLFALYRKGIEIFGDRDAFNRWLQKSAFGLGGQVPLDLLSMSTGIDLVMDELARIEFGTTA